MDIFKQSLAPIPQTAWQEINSRAEEVIQTLLTTRKSLLTDGPNGLSKTHVTSGRLNILENELSRKVKIGLYDVRSLMETRIKFSLSRWELDNIIRGAKDINLEPLEKAMKELVFFEENTIYNGNKAANIQGLMNEATNTLKVKLESEDILSVVTQASLILKNAFAKKPYNLIVGNSLYKSLNKAHGSRLLKDFVENIIEGKVILSESLEGGLLLPVKHPDLEFTIGQDYTIGYESHDQENVNLFIMNSYTLRVLNPDVLVKFKLS